MNYPSGNLGSEFYAGVADQVGAACNRGEWDALRRGDFSAALALFPSCVHGLDVLLLAEAIADITGKAPVELIEKERSVAGEERLWGADVLPPTWVASVAAIDFDDVPRLRMRWKEIHARQYEAEPQFNERDWMDDSTLHACRALVGLAKLATQGSLEVVEIWTL